VAPVDGALGGQDDARGDALRASFSDELNETKEHALRPLPFFPVFPLGIGSRRWAGIDERVLGHEGDDGCERTFPKLAG